jgi:23S rRNA-/tRNA-specific pseudouridylate synthase
VTAQIQPEHELAADDGADTEVPEQRVVPPVDDLGDLETFAEKREPAGLLVAPVAAVTLDPGRIVDVERTGGHGRILLDGFSLLYRTGWPLVSHRLEKAMRIDPRQSEPKQLTLTCRVDSYRSGWTVLDFLAHRFRYHPRALWERRIAEGRVAVNGRTATARSIVLEDDEVSYTIEHTEPPVDDRYNVLYEDEHLLAVSKSGNIPVHASGVYITHTLIARLRERYGDSLALAHRLDRETSGVVVLAKHREAARALSGMFQRGEVRKRYLAVVWGHLWPSTFTVDAPIARNEAGHGRVAEPVSAAPGRPGPSEEVSLKDRLVGETSRGEDGRASKPSTDLGRPRLNLAPKRLVDPVRGKPARTRVRLLRIVGPFSLVEAVPLTGRTHQIRLHLAHVGFPVVGDKLYGLSEAPKREFVECGMTDRVRRALVLDRHALHCERLEFRHPITDEPIVIGAPVPEDMGKWFERGRAAERRRELDRTIWESPEDPRR